MRAVADIGLAISLAAGIESIFGRHGIALPEDHRTAVGRFGDGAVARAVVEHLEADAQRIEDHLDTHQRDQRNGHAARPHHVTPRAGMAPRIVEQHVNESETGDDHPLGLHVSPQGREQEEADEGHGQQFQGSSDRRLRLHLPPRLHVQRHEEEVEDDQHVAQKLDDVTGFEDRVAAREVIGERRPVVVVLPHEVRHEQQQSHGPAQV